MTDLPLARRPPRILSAGMGVQSSTILAMAIEGVERVDAGIFADTGWEPKAVYDWIAFMRTKAAEAGIPLVTVNGGNLRDDEMSNTRHVGSRGKYTLMPLYLKNADGTKGKLRRICTSRYKIEPIHRFLRRVGATTERPAEMLIGISLDEYQRAKDSHVSYVRNVFPLLDRRMTRDDCLAWMRDHGYPEPPKSACVTCPFRRDDSWQDMRLNRPEDWDEAVKFDRLIREHYDAFDGTPYLHESRLPLEQAIPLTPLPMLTAARDASEETDGCGVLCAADDEDVEEGSL